MITKDDFEQWRANPVTEEVSRALVRLAERNKAEWMRASWDCGEANPVILADLKARYETANDLSELTFEQLEEALNEE